MYRVKVRLDQGVNDGTLGELDPQDLLDRDGGVRDGLGVFGYPAWQCRSVCVQRRVGTQLVENLR